MSGTSRPTRTLTLFFTLLFLLLAGQARAATYDANGRWSVTFTPNPPVVTDTPGCLPAQEEPFVIAIAQTGDAFTATETQETPVSGTVSGADYAYNATLADGATRNLSFTLASTDAGSGTASMTWPNNTQGGTVCQQAGTVTLTRALPSVLPVSGTWTMRLEADQLDPALSAAGCAAEPARNLPTGFIRILDTFLISVNDTDFGFGAIDGGIFTVKIRKGGATYEESILRFLQSSPDSMAGAIRWVRNNGTMLCAGSNLVSLTRDGSGDGNPEPSLTVAPINLAVGQTRPVSFDLAVGPPSLMITPESGVATLTTTSGLATVTCDAPGSATVTVIDAKVSASAVVNCVAPLDPATGDLPLAESLFLPGRSMVNEHLWQGDAPGSPASRSFEWMQPAGNATWLNRTVSVLAGDGEQYFTLDASGLAFHGGKRYDPASDEVRRFAWYGFVAPPNLAFPSGARAEDVAAANLTTPSPLLPAFVGDGLNRVEARVEYQLDANNAPISGQWTVVKQEAGVSGNINLLAATPPTDLLEDRFFAQWRDAITDPALLSALTRVMRIHLVETRFLPGNPLGAVSSGDLYLAPGVGIVYESWRERDGLSRNALVATESGGSLTSLTRRAVKARNFRIDAPAGVILTNPFVEARVEHTGHSHQWQAVWNATPGGNSAALRIYSFSASPAWDPDDVVTLTHGAKGFERQRIASYSFTNADPMVLTLTAAQQGRQVNLTVKDDKGVALGNARLSRYPYRNGACDWTGGIDREVSAAGTVTLTIADGQHCLALWPNDPRAFIGGHFDPTRAYGLLNILAPESGFAGLPITVSASQTSFQLVAGRDLGPARGRVSGLLTDGTQPLANATILAYPKNGGEPLLFHADASGAFAMDLPVGEYRFQFRNTGDGYVDQAWLASSGAVNTLAATSNATLAIHTDMFLGPVILNHAFRVNTATLSGTIGDATSGQRVVWPATVLIDSLTPGFFSTRVATDGAGAWSAQLPPSLDYRVRVEASGSGKLYRGYVDGYETLVADPVALAPLTMYDTRVLNLTITDALGVDAHPVTGQVSDDRAAPVANATVRLFDPNDPARSFAAVTDGQGNFALWAPAGSYRIEFFAHGFRGGLANGSGDFVALGGSADAGTYSLPDAAALVLRPVLARLEGGFDPGIARIVVSGSVTGVAGALANIQVVFHPDAANTTFVDAVTVITDAAGRYAAAIYPGSYRVRFHSEYQNANGQLVRVAGVLGQGGFADGTGKITDLAANARLFHFDQPATLDALMPGGVRVSGLVTDAASAPLAQVRVAFQPDLLASGGADAPYVEAVADANGAFVAFVKPGVPYRVFFNTDYWDWQTQKQVKVAALSGFADAVAESGVASDPAKAQSFTWSGETILKTARLAAGLTLSGKVTSDGSTPIAGVKVRLQPDAHPVSGVPGTWGETTTDANGNYAFTVQPSDYRLEFVNAPGGRIGGFADGNGGVVHDWMAAALFRVTDAKTVNAVLPAGVGFAGVVRDAADQLVAGARIHLHSTDWRVNFWAASDDQGAFALQAIPGLEYQAEIWPADCTAPCTASFMGGVWANADPLLVASVAPEGVSGSVAPRVEGGNPTTIRLDRALSIVVRVDAGLALDGQVVDDLGHGIGNAWVSGDFGAAMTDEVGMFVLRIPTLVNKPTFQVRIFPGTQGGGFLGGYVTHDPALGYTLGLDGVRAQAFASNRSDWPADALDYDKTGMRVRVRAGITIEGTVADAQSGAKAANVWVHAWSHAAGIGAGDSTNANGGYAIQVPRPAAGVSVWYEVNLWSDRLVVPAPVMVQVTEAGVVAVHAIDKGRPGGNGEPLAGAILLGDPRGGVPVDFAVSSGNVISGRVTDANNAGLPWVWVDIHARDGSRWYGANTDAQGYYKVTVAPGSDYLGVVWGMNGRFRTTYFNNAGREGDATLIDASAGKNPGGVDFVLRSGASIGGTIAGLSAGAKVRLSVWSESEQAWGGAEVTGGGSGSDVFTISGLVQASDYRLEWRGAAEDLPSGYYGGSGLGPVGWEKAVALNTLAGNVTGVAINLAASTTRTLRVKVSGLEAGAAADLNVWSEKWNKGRSRQVTADASGVAVAEIKGLDPAGNDYRLFVGGPGALFASGNFQGTVSATTYPATPGGLVGRDRATLLDMASDRYVAVAVSPGRKLTVTVTGLASGARAWVDAFSERSGASGGGEVVDGQVVLKGLRAVDDYRVSIRGETLTNGAYAGEGQPVGDWKNAVLVDLRNGDGTIAMAVASGSSISGTVSGVAKGRPGRVEAWSNATYSWGGSAIEGSDAYAVKGLSVAADYRVSFQADGYLPQKRTGVSAPATEVNFSAATGGGITGGINGLNAREWVRVDAWSPSLDVRVVGSALADASGVATYALSGLPAGEDYVVGVWRGNAGVFYASGGATPVWSGHTQVTVSGGDVTTGIDFNVALTGNRFYTLSGTVSEMSGDRAVEVRAWSATAGATAALTGNGEFTLTGLPAGNYTVEVRAAGYVTKHTGSVSVSANRVSTVNWSSDANVMGTVTVAGDTTGLNIPMTPGHAIAGSVTGGSGPAGGVVVNAWSDGGRVGGSALTNASGAFAIEGLPDGDYRVDVRNGEGEASATLTLAGADRTGVAMTLAKAGGVISGTVSLSGGSGAGGAMVIAYDSGGAERKRVVADGAGLYRLDGLNPNQAYTLKAFSSAKVQAGNWSAASGYGSGGATAVAGGTTLNLTLN
ncbi:MAG: carboxypeptidase regulatory-like domain-containing protein [Magnetococcales bacterium]|nr:carboxypeptidase regulatory-like domain-containing protein [Magnetococcales bacterium]